MTPGDEKGDWYGDFRAIARIALYGKPQWLEELEIGQTVRELPGFT